jgi:hypothetical protein
MLKTEALVLYSALLIWILIHILRYVHITDGHSENVDLTDSLIIRICEVSEGELLEVSSWQNTGFIESEMNQAINFQTTKKMHEILDYLKSESFDQFDEPEMDINSSETFDEK